MLLFFQYLIIHEDKRKYLETEKYILTAVLQYNATRK